MPAPLALELQNRIKELYRFRFKNKEIAEYLGITEVTVCKYVAILKAQDTPRIQPKDLDYLEDAINA